MSEVLLYNFARSKTGVLKDMEAVELWLRELLGQVIDANPNREPET